MIFLVETPVSDFLIRKVKQVSDGYEHSTCNIMRAF